MCCFIKENSTNANLRNVWAVWDLVYKFWSLYLVLVASFLIIIIILIVIILYKNKQLRSNERNNFERQSAQYSAGIDAIRFFTENTIGKYARHFPENVTFIPVNSNSDIVPLTTHASVSSRSITTGYIKFNILFSWLIKDAAIKRWQHTRFVTIKKH